MEVRTDTGMWSVPLLVLSDVREENGDMIMQKKMGEGLSMLGNEVEEWWPCDNYRAFKSIQGFWGLLRMLLRPIKGMERKGPSGYV